jgi:ketosteroid isomerase-like protein
MSQATEFDYVRRMFAAFDAKEVTALADLVTDDVSLRLGNAPIVQGKPAFVAAVNAFFGSVAGVRHEFLNLLRASHTVIAESDVHYIRLDGGKVSLPCCNVFKLRDGLVSEYRSCMDATPVYEVVGKRLR